MVYIQQTKINFLQKMTALFKFINEERTLMWMCQIHRIIRSSKMVYAGVEVANGVYFTM